MGSGLFLKPSISNHSAIHELMIIYIKIDARHILLATASFQTQAQVYSDQDDPIIYVRLAHTKSGIARKISFLLRLGFSCLATKYPSLDSYRAVFVNRLSELFE